MVKPSKNLKFILFNLGIIFALLLSLEGACRLFLLAEAGANTERFRILRWIHAGIHGEGYNGADFNNLGFCSVRNNTASTDKTLTRILVIGGSAAAGSPEVNWPDMLGDLLNGKENSGKFEILNGGVGGSTSSRQMFSLSRLIYLKPDIVIIYDGWNEVYFSHYAAQGYRLYDESRRKAVFSGERRFKFFLRRYSELFCRLENFRKAIFSSSRKTMKKQNALAAQAEKSVFDYNVPAGSPGDAAQINQDFYGIASTYFFDPEKPVQDNFSRIYNANLRTMVEISRKSGAKVLLVTQPSLLDYRNAVNPGVKLPDSLHMEWRKHQDWMHAVQTLYPLLKQTARKVADEYRVPYEDFRDVFGNIQDGTLYFTDDVHQTTLGKQVIAQAMYNKMETLGWTGKKRAGSRSGADWAYLQKFSQWVKKMKSTVDTFSVDWTSLHQYNGAMPYSLGRRRSLLSFFR